MRDKEQEANYQAIIKKTIQDVKSQFKEIYMGIEFGAYIKPEHYFVSYIFKTNRQLQDAKNKGITEMINTYHKEQLKKNAYPFDGIKDCCFATQEDCDLEYNGNWYYYYK